MARAARDREDFHDNLHAAWRDLHELWLLTRRHPAARDNFSAAAFTIAAHVDAVRASVRRPHREEA